MPAVGVGLVKESRLCVQTLGNVAEIYERVVDARIAARKFAVGNADIFDIRIQRIAFPCIGRLDIFAVRARAPRAVFLSPPSRA